MGRIGAWVVGIIVALVIILGALAGYFSYTKNQESEIKNEVTVEYIKDVYDKDIPAVMRVYVVGKSFTKLTYQIGASEEVEINATIDTVDESWELYRKSWAGRKYIDSNIMSIDLSSYNPGKHVITFYVYDGESVREEIYEKSFRLVE